MYPVPREGIVMSGNQDLLRLAELLCARLCHDLSGPLGALIGILDLAREEAPDSETVSLAEETATELAQRLNCCGRPGDARVMIWTKAAFRTLPRVCCQAGAFGSIWTALRPSGCFRRQPHA